MNFGGNQPPRLRRLERILKRQNRGPLSNRTRIGNQSHLIANVKIGLRLSFHSPFTIEKEHGSGPAKPDLEQWHDTNTH
jgi:hypothetical protein